MAYEYLKQIRDLMYKIPEDKFQIQAWKTAEATKPLDLEKFDCGFAGCAIGWAIMAKIVPGLEIVDMYPGAPYITLRGKDGQRPPYNDINFSAVAVALGITHDESFHLFNGFSEAYLGKGKGGQDVRPKDVAEAIQEFLEKKESEVI